MYDPGPLPADGDGATLLDEVRKFLCTYVAFPSEAAAVATTLWTVHAHAAGAADSTPRLALLSPEPGSGKTRTLEVLELLTPRPMFVLSASPAAIFRTIEEARPVLLFDECDAIFTRHGKDDTNEDLRALLNAGHRKGATIPRCVGPLHLVQRFPVYCPAALAGLGDLPPTLMSRSVVVRMRRRGPGEHVEPFRHREAAPPGGELRDRLAEWAASVEDELALAWPKMPPGITDRPADVWEPLLAIADAAGAGWPQRARAACTELAGAAETGEASLGVRLLGDLRDVFGTAVALSTAGILDRLHKLEESPWSDLKGKPLDPRGLASRLRQYEVRSVKVKIGDRPLQGYRAEDLHDAWSRYLAPVTAEAEPPEPPEPAWSEDPLPVPLADEVPEPEPDPEPDDPPPTCDVPEVPEVPAMREPESAPVCTECGELLDPALIAAGFTTHGEDEADSWPSCSRCGERPGGGDRGQTYCGPCIAEVHEEYRQKAGAMARLQAEQEAELEHVCTWTWERLVLPPYHKRRVRETVTVSRHPSGWIANLGLDDPQVCSAVFDYAHARKLDDFKAFHANHPVIWKCQVQRSRSRSTQYFCDAHLPGEFRPNDETSTEGKRP